MRDNCVRVFTTSPSFGGDVRARGSFPCRQSCSRTGLTLASEGPSAPSLPKQSGSHKLASSSANQHAAPTDVHVVSNGGDRSYRLEPGSEWNVQEKQQWLLTVPSPMKWMCATAACDSHFQTSGGDPYQLNRRLTSQPSPSNE